ncbi:hypothetical protein GO755_24735 [Spirosoma sp. HMF4905]|uniref:Uncharacterized protein n=1 Tax=Spirosoma arboris TaxID=2682092 RepID=A0A7K1SHI7_9BACT|nr:hypothetical protein [Spirosoma arboris]MVM33270.1 hypothetical protein [Spirosoma arboris]
MKYLLRFHLYDNPSRQSFYQLGPDQWVKKRPQYVYGLPYRLEPEEFGPIGAPGQVYVLANPLRVKPLLDSAKPTQSQLLIEVFFARLEEWGWFREAPEVSPTSTTGMDSYQPKPVEKVAVRAQNSQQ